MTATNSTNPKLVHDLARTGITTCFDTTLFVEAVRTLLKKNIESLIVLDDYSRAIGIFSRHEAVETYARSGINATNFDTLTVADVMRSDIPQVSANIPAITAAQIMLDQGLRNIYLMHHKNAGTPDRPVGLLSLDDIIGEMIGESEWCQTGQITLAVGDKLVLVSKNNDLKLVRNLMHIGVTTCPADMPVLEATRLLYTQDIESLIVLDENGHSAGVFGKKEAAQIYAQTAGNGAGLQTLTVADAMRADILEVPPDIPAPAAAQIMLDQARREIHLLHHAGGIGWPAAVFRFEDILRYLAAETEADVAALGVGAPRKSAIELFRERYAKKT